MFKKRNIKLYFVFYKSFWFFSTVISILCAFYLMSDGASIYAPLFWFKIGTLAFVFYYIRAYKAKEFLFYKNLGISRRALWVFSFSFDMIIYFVLVIIALKVHAKFT